MIKRKKNLKFILSILLVSFLFLGTLASGYTIFAENQEGNGSDDDEYTSNISLFRPDFSDLENIIATYTNYWRNDPEQKVFDQNAWALKDFVVEYELHIDGETKTVVKNMTYTADSYSWEGNISFENIKIPYDKVEVEYYNADDGSLVEPYLLHYDLYLKKADGKMILKIPRLAPRPTYTGPMEEAKLIKVKEIKVNEANPERKNLYLDGKNGDDKLDGTAGNAVKTFKRAKEIATGNKNIKRIFVVGTTEIEGDISLAGTNAQILRGESFNDYLFSVGSGKSASLSDIVVDGNSEKNSNIEKSLIEIKSSATLNINSGANLRNNKIKFIENTSTEGGAVYANSATINMSGGIIENNQATYGGGIHLHKSTMNFTGGTVKNNKSNLVIDYAYGGQKYSAGGGIIANEGSTIKMSADAKVLNNYADEIGGGISLGSNQAGAANILNMTGGIIDGNTAGASGGGIFIQAGLSNGSQSKAYISSGLITNNKMNGRGKTDAAFGGGGIYVNGIANPWEWQGQTYYGVNGELYLKNAVITDNTSKEQGAGLACCPIAKTKIYVNDGVALYGNKTSEIGKDLFIYSDKNFGPHSGQSEYELSKLMLGGAPYNWTMYNGAPLSDKNHKGTLSIADGARSSYLALNVKSEGNELTRALAKVYITGNTSATRGAGIGSNGSVFFGTDEETTKVSVEKKWDDNNNKDGSRTASVKVKLIASLDGSDEEYLVEERILNEENNWKTTFTDLPTKAGEKEIIYSIKEVKVDGYTGKITGTAKEGFIVTNTRIPEKINLQVTKAWKDGNNQDGKRPNSVKIKLLADGKEVSGKTLTLTKANNWTGSFTDLDKYKDGKKIEYTIKEESVGNGYVSIITGSMKDGYKVTNTREPEKIKVEGKKTWNDKNNQDGKRPEEITINLLKNGTKIDSKVVKKSDDWKWKFEGLDKYENGQEITYTISEEAVEGYSTEINGYDVKNSYTPEKTSIQVTKAWKDGNNQDGKRPNSVKIKLLADGKEVSGKTLTLTKENNWTGSFTDLDKYKDGKKIDYTIKEESVGNGYVSIITGSMKEGYKVTNTREPEKIKVEGKKTWNDKNNQDGKRPEEITINLLKNGTKIDSKVVKKSDDWKWKFEGLDKYENGQEIKYTISEDKVDKYTTKIDGFNIINTYIPPEKPPTPDTSDRSSMIILCITLMAASFVAITALRSKHSR